MDNIIIKGARENNLKNIDITLPKNKLIVMTGVSGSGKSSLAFDTIYAEGQRRYVDSLSAYARQFLGGTEKPKVDSIEGLSPAIAIDQKTTNKNPRSTVGTITEIYDYLRLLYARIGVPYCPNHNIPISSQSIEEMTNQVLKLETGTKFRVRVVKKTDEFSISIDGFTQGTQSIADKDKYVTIDPTIGKLIVSDSSTPESSTGSVMIGKIMRKHVDGSVITTVAHNYGYSRTMYEIKVENLG